MRELVSFLKTHGLQKLCTDYAIQAERHFKYPNLVCLNYDQLESPKDVKEAQQCRGIILDEADDFKVISYPYDRFFNQEEPRAAKLDASSTKVSEKLDGSLAILFFYKDEWHVQSRKKPDGGGFVKRANRTFRDLFWEVFKEKNYILPAETDRCFIFELCTTFQDFIVVHKENSLVLHGVRNLTTMKEEGIEQYARYNFQLVKTFAFKDLKAMADSLCALSPIEQEGYVLVDKNFMRCKVKSNQYVALHLLGDEFTGKRLLTVLLNYEGDEFLTYFPEYKDKFFKIKGAYENAMKETAELWGKVKEIQNQKEFALNVASSPFKSILFSLKSGKLSSIKKGFSEVNIDKLLSYLESE